MMLLIKFIYVSRIRMKQYQYLIEKREKSGLKPLEDPKALIEYSHNVQNSKKIFNSITQAENVMH